MHSAGQMILTKITMAGALLWSVAHTGTRMQAFI